VPALLALAAAAVFGAADFTGGYAARRTHVATVTLVTNVVGVAIATVLVLVLGGAWTTSSIGWGAAGGACGLVGIVLLYFGLATGPNRLVSPLSAVVAAAIPVVVGLATGDRPGELAIVGLAITPFAIWLVAGGDLRAASGATRSLAIAVGAGVGFGLFFVCLAQTPDDAGAVPLLAARLTSTTLMLAAVATGRAAPPTRADIPIPVLAGTLDMGANGLFLWSAIDGDLAVVGALVSFYPVTTVLLAMAILGERVSRSQALGLILAVACAALLS
jgi:drug/metabolite transporter (DMT)-like permease